MSLYLWIDLLSLSVPLLASFHPRIRLYKNWKALFMALMITLVPFIIWDAFFTARGYWGFDQNYVSGIYLFYLPLEEWLFFICIPYACVFTHLAIVELYPKLRLSPSVVRVVTYSLMVIFALLLLLNFDRAYTVVDTIFAIVVLTVAWRMFRNVLGAFYLTFLVMLIPFFIVNGILTGTGLERPVVWYDNMENLNVRLGTIPVEDVIYAFSLILMNLLLFFRFSSAGTSQRPSD